MREKLQPSQETFKWLFYSGSEVQRRHFAEPVGRQKIEEHVVTDSDLRNDESRSSLTSSAVTEERQDVSSKNTIDEMTDAIIVGNTIDFWALWPANTSAKVREYWLKYEKGSFWHCDEKSFLKHGVPQYIKHRNLSRKCTTSLIHHQNHKGEVVDRSWPCVSFSQTCVKCFTCRLMYADTTKCAHFLIRKRIFDWKHGLERLRNHEHSVEHIDAAIIFSPSRRCN